MSKINSTSLNVEIDSQPIWYEKFGSGSKPILMIPGAIGTGRSDFMPQLEGKHALNQQEYTIITVEAPGWGRSSSSDREFGSYIYQKDAQCYFELMQQLGYKKFLLFGWSDGAKSALLIASRYPNAVMALVLSGISIYGTDKCIKFLSSISDINSWDKGRVDSLLRSYETREEIQLLWTKFLNFAQYYNQYYPQNIFNCKAINCRVLVIFGEKDQTTDIQQSSHVCKEIKRSQLYRFTYAGHDFHLKYPSTFKKIIEDHFSQI